MIHAKSTIARDVMLLYQHVQFVQVHLFLIMMDQNAYVLVDNLVMVSEDVVTVE